MTIASTAYTGDCNKLKYFPTPRVVNICTNVQPPVLVDELEDLVDSDAEREQVRDAMRAVADA